MGAELDRDVHPPETMNMSVAEPAELYVFVQLLSKAGCEREVRAGALLTVLDASRDEPGCVVSPALHGNDPSAQPAGSLLD